MGFEDTETIGGSRGRREMSLSAVAQPDKSSYLRCARSRDFSKSFFRESFFRESVANLSRPRSELRLRVTVRAITWPIDNGSATFVCVGQSGSQVCFRYTAIIGSRGSGEKACPLVATVPSASISDRGCDNPPVSALSILPRGVCVYVYVKQIAYQTRGSSRYVIFYFAYSSRVIFLCTGKQRTARRESCGRFPKGMLESSPITPFPIYVK